MKLLRISPWQKEGDKVWITDAARRQLAWRGGEPVHTFLLSREEVRTEIAVFPKQSPPVVFIEPDAPEWTEGAIHFYFNEKGYLKPEYAKDHCLGTV